MFIKRIKNLRVNFLNFYKYSLIKLFNIKDEKRKIIIIGSYHRHFIKIGECFERTQQLEFILTGIPPFRIKGTSIDFKRNYVWINKLGFLTLFIRSKIDKYGFTKFKSFLSDMNSRSFDVIGFFFLIKLKIIDILLNKKKNRILIVSAHIGYFSIKLAKLFNWITICEMPIANTREIHARLVNEFSKYNLENYYDSKRNFYLVEEKAIKECNVLVVPNKMCKKSFYSLKDESQIKLAPYPFPNWKKESIDILNKNNLLKFKILTVGRLGIRKGTHIILDIFREIEENIDEWTLIGQESNELGDRLKEFKSSRKLKIKGSLRHDEIKPFLRESTIFLLPSLGEGQPYSIGEAFHYNCQVICSNFCGITPNEYKNIHVIDGLDTKEYIKKIYEIKELWRKAKLTLGNENILSKSPYQDHANFKRNWIKLLDELKRNEL